MPGSDANKGGKTSLKIEDDTDLLSSWLKPMTSYDARLCPSRSKASPGEAI
jgi:hypothetical protein